MASNSVSYNRSSIISLRDLLLILSSEFSLFLSFSNSFSRFDKRSFNSAFSFANSWFGSDGEGALASFLLSNVEVVVFCS